jgi:hypothetical protein
VEPGAEDLGGQADVGWREHDGSGQRAEGSPNDPLPVAGQLPEGWRKGIPGHPGPRPKSSQDINDVRVEAAGNLAAAEKRIAELERKIGQQQVELDFFQRALRQVGASRPISGPGAKASTPSSKR